MARILIVDDEPFIRSILADVLAGQGHQVEQASDATEGLAQFPAVKPELVISDIVMPGMTGLEFVAELRNRETGPSVPIILLSGTETVNDPFEHVPLGADLTLSKSEALSRLPSVVVDLLARG